MARHFYFLLLLVALCLVEEIVSLGIHTSPQKYCYRDPECNSESSHWPEICQKGKLQSPINLEVRNRSAYKNYSVFSLEHLTSSKFRMNNNGHSLNVQLSGSRISRSFPGFGKFKFSGVHFHWGRKPGNGSEHCVNGKCFDMEMHLVHYKAKYSSKAKALSSGDPHALTVVAVFLKVNPKLKTGNKALVLILRNMEIVRNASGNWEEIGENIDLTPLMPRKGVVYSYKGSLTTPPCTESVNWYIFEKPVSISPSDVEAFRNLRDEEGEMIEENHRPLQEKNGRKIDIIRIIRIWNSS